MSDPIVVWQCSEQSKHRGWRDERVPEERLRRGTCDYCFARTLFEMELDPGGGVTEFAPDAFGVAAVSDEGEYWLVAGFREERVSLPSLPEGATGWHVYVGGRLVGQVSAPTDEGRFDE